VKDIRQSTWVSDSERNKAEYLGRYLIVKEIRQGTWVHIGALN
jgi:hypothetical protein